MDQIANFGGEEPQQAWQTAKVSIRYSEGSFICEIIAIFKVMIEAGIQPADIGAAVNSVLHLLNIDREEDAKTQVDGTTDATVKNVIQNNPHINFGNIYNINGGVNITQVGSFTSVEEALNEAFDPPQNDNDLRNTRSETHDVEYDDKGKSKKTIHKSGPPDQGKGE